MKKLLLLVLICFIQTIVLYAQIPERFNYQGILRNASGELITNTEISLQISLLEGSSTANASYIEQHTVSTNNNGQFALFIGTGTVHSGTFSTMDWSTGQIFLKTEVDVNGGTDFTELSTVQLISVPYALYAKDVVNKDDADASPTNEIQDISLSGTNLSITNGSVVDLSVLQDGVNDADSDLSNELQTLILAGDTLEISQGNNIILPYDSSYWSENGNKIYYNTGNVGIGSTNPVSRLEVKGNITSEALFQVINANNDTVFAVYPDGVKVFVDPSVKGKVGGFAVSGRSPSKAGEVDFMKVTYDSTRIYVNENVVKAKVGGFAVSGRSPSKGILNDYLVVTEDSTRIYVSNDPVKAKVGGFAVSGRSPSKGSSEKFMDITPLNSFIGLEAGKSNTTGERNAFIGYQSGFTNTEGVDNVFIGNETGFANETGSYNIFLGTQSGKSNTTGVRNVFIGTSAGVNHTSGLQNIVIGHQAGEKLENGLKNVFIGTVAGANNIEGDDNVFIGNFAGWQNQNNSNVFIGRTAGMSNTVGSGNVFIGEQSGRSNVEGSGNVFIGKGAGQNELGSNRLYISNSYTTYPLLYGEFDNGIVEVKGSIKLTNLLNMKPVSSYPGSPEEGDVFYDSNSNSIKYFNGTEWMELTATVSASPPRITTDSIPELFILADSVLVYGNVTDQGSSAITDCGVCYSENQFYDKALAYGCISATPELGSFSVNFTGLSQYQDFYFRAFATNSDGTAMGEMIHVFTPIASSLPTVETKTVLNIGQTSAVGGGNVSAPGGVKLTDMGICWSLSPEPTIADNKTIETVALGEFNSNITGLSSNTKYYVRAYATNGNGTDYGEEVTFTTASDVTTVTDADGIEYNTVQIGNQTWMKENLRTTKYNDGSDIPEVTVYDEWIVLESGAFCWYDNDSASYNDPYGVLYNNAAILDSRNICPSGWHVPSDTEWTELLDYLGGQEEAGGRLRETGTTHWTSDPGVDNSSGFTAVGSGYRYTDTDFNAIDNFAQWYTATEESDTKAWTYYISHNSLSLMRIADIKSGGYSVRCIKD